MAQTTGTPALNPPPPGDPLSTAETPQALDRYDLVLGGTGFMVYRASDDSNPSEHFKPEPIDYTYSPVFIERTNVQGDLGDNVQDFYMTFVQRDWSGGMGQKYFRQQADRERSFWDGSFLKPTVVPGATTIGPREQTQALINGTDRFCQMLYIKETGNVTTTQGDVLAKVEGTGSVSIKLYGSRDGGGTWTLQPTTASQIWADACDVVAGDNGIIYFLEGTGTASSKVHQIPGLTLGMPGAGVNTVAWTNWTAFSFIANAIEYYNGGVYVAGNDATLRLVTSAGGAGTTIKDLGGGKIIDILASGGYLWVLYLSAQGDYRLYQYDGSSVTEVARLPRGWKMQYNTETSLRNMDVLDTSPTATHVRQVNCMCYQDGVVYVSGMTPTRDWAQSQRNACPFRTALWYYASGNTGLIWEADNTQQHYYWGGGSAWGPRPGGPIAFADVLNNKLMCYDPNTGGVFPLSSITNPVSGTVAGGLGVQLASGVSTNSLVTTVHVADFNGMPSPGTVLQRTAGGTISELMLVTSENGIGPADLTLVRGYLGTTPNDASLAGMTTSTTKTCAFTLPITPIYRLEYDWSNHVLHAVWLKDDGDFIQGGLGAFTAMQNQHTFWKLRDAKSNDYGVVATSNFDFNSSLQKYFRSVSVDYEKDQMNRTDSENGTVDIYYKIDGVISTTTDTGIHLVKSGAASGTSYDILDTGTNIQIIVQLNSPATVSAQPQSLGPVLKRISVKGAPILPGFRRRKYQIALLDDLILKDGTREQTTPALLRKALEALIQANTPFAASDSSMTNVTCVFEPDSTTIREIRPNEYIAYAVLREV